MLKHQKSREYYTVFIILCAVILSACVIWTQPFLQNNQLGWDINEVIVTEGYEPNAVEHVQLFLVDKAGRPIINGQVLLNAQSEKSHATCKQWMHHVDQGLYESECLFTESGKWKADVFVAGAQSKQQFTYFFTVQPMPSMDEFRSKRK
ncbi:hypothetical protein [Alkalicoccobacillus porphyridii]|uniref:YtkA-like domain-containing protein n=1 Tax=Alkalicoccobacillus porphyridii TaxID=2597270 RepID=A0A553ZWH6_9BACI|nr:hypothetical protein [Alkalicoccobacillus porphyridii]TSB45818.1 hypothetical protein FN960_15165 [Alkalicoccobacillus porphyridii]